MVFYKYIRPTHDQFDPVLLDRLVLSYYNKVLFETQ